MLLILAGTNDELHLVAEETAFDGQLKEEVSSFAK